MSNKQDQIREAAIQAVREATRLCRSVQGRIQPEALTKKDLSPVTVADYGSQALICRALQRAFPADPVIAEEDSADLRKPENAGLRALILDELRAIDPATTDVEMLRWIDHGGASEYSGRFWTLDPIDGTKGFLRGEQYAVSLALIVGGVLEAAAMSCPNLPNADGTIGAIFFAARGEGAVAIALDRDDSLTPVRVSRTSDISRARFCESVESGHSSHNDAAAVAARLGIVEPPARLDSQAKYAVVARGEAEIYLRLPTRADYREKIWDHAGGALIVAEAGGVVTDVTGKLLDFTHGRELAVNRGIVVANGPETHAKVLGALVELGVR